MSPLALGTGLFIVYGLVYILIGALTPFMHDTPTGREMLFLSPRTDTTLFGARPAELLRADPQLSQLRSLLIQVIGGLLLSAGVLILGITWFALRAGQGWALAVLSVAGLVVLPIWVIVFRPYISAGASPELADLPPFMWIPARVLLPAIALSWIGLRAEQ